jgi:hypothetical protein
MSMFNNPCKCCGSNEHPLLKIIDKDNVRVQIECPVIVHNSVGEMLSYEQKELMYRPRPLRFAGLYGHQEAECFVALKLLDSLGIGKYWTWHVYREFNEKVLEACVNYSRQNVFKRDQSLECHHVEEVEFYEEDENSSTSV